MAPIFFSLGVVGGREKAAFCGRGIWFELGVIQILN